MVLSAAIAGGLLSGAGGAGISALGGLAGGLLSSASSARSAKRAYKYSRLLQQHQYDLNQQSLRESPTNSRLGYTDAGYNPLMTLGSNMSGMTPSATMSPTENNLGSDVINGLNSAISAIQSKSQIDNTNASTKLVNEQAETEKAKRIQMDFQNAMTDVETHLKQKDLSSYDRRFYQEIYESMQRAENYKANSAVSRMNAETERINAETNKFNSAISAKRAKFQNFKDYHDAKYGNPLKTAGFAWDNIKSYYKGGIPNF